MGFYRAYPNGTFAEFVAFFVNQAAPNCSSVQNFTFEDCGINPHFTPYVTRCGYCGMNYKVTSRLDTLEEDLINIEKMAGKQILFDKPKKKNSSPGSSSAQRAKDMFATVDKELTQKLYDIYQIDFEMFGYTTEGYF